LLLLLFCISQLSVSLKYIYSQKPVYKGHGWKPENITFMRPCPWYVDVQIICISGIWLLINILRFLCSWHYIYQYFDFWEVIFTEKCKFLHFLLIQIVFPGPLGRKDISKDNKSIMIKKNLLFCGTKMALIAKKMYI